MNDGDAIETTKVVEADPRCAVPHDTLKQTLPMVCITSRTASYQKQILHNGKFVHEFL
jgi:hypothetical protein